MKKYEVTLKHENVNDCNKGMELNENQKQRIYNIYKRDFEIFGYEF